MFGAGITYTLFAPDVAQRLLVEPGHYSQIYVEAKSGVSEERLCDQVAAVLPAGYEAVTGEQEAGGGKAEIKQIFDSPSAAASSPCSGRSGRAAVR